MEILGNTALKVMEPAPQGIMFNDIALTIGDMQTPPDDFQMGIPIILLEITR